MGIDIAETDSTCYELQPDIGFTLSGRRRSHNKALCINKHLLLLICTTAVMHQKPQYTSAVPDWS